ncbi:XRE family transcriptional regulator [[Clostridium] sordellii]|uniref:helix-turn-helix domain-containing protein n=1 Tax=Paraclostridium sordellii TaxID=1505 RepID=UPI0005DF721B|nr:helix-turn-helix transcriptional regulator [Paeniclostridium sordellii]CEP46417.1 XRE family transcriptional regulator [[Clostridium] sordellii] [Paeniclostridium sordellii]CEQ26610.1 XRE family transcriptional regulator [[Clostridium] sordellii] [Paeniclostridium sordellii]
MKKENLKNSEVCEPLDLDRLDMEIESFDEESKFFFESYEIEFKFISNLTNRRKEMGLTQKELARKTGLTQQVISNIEKCGRRPTLINLIRYTMGLGLDLNRIFD